MIVFLCLPVKCQHTTSYEHVTRHLSTHPSNQQHFIAAIGMESGIVDVLGLPQFLYRQTIQFSVFPASKKSDGNVIL